MKVEGRYERKLEPQSGMTKAGKAWSKETIIVRTNEEYDNIYPIEFFGDKAIGNLNQVSVGDSVDVEFNIKANEYNGRHYVSLGGWKIAKVASSEPTKAPEVVPEAITNDDDGDSLPF